MTRTRVLAVALAVALALQSVAAVAGVAAAQDAGVAISDVTVVPEQPAPGEEFEVTVNLSNYGGSDESVRVTDLYVRSNGELKEYTRVDNPGAIPAGGQLTVPFTLSFEEKGTKNLRVHATVQTGDGDYTKLQYPLYVTVDEPDDVLVSMPTSEATADEETPVNVTVANGASEPITGVSVSLEGDGSVATSERVVGSIEGASDRAFNYTVNFSETGPHDLQATVTYTTAQGVTRTVTESSTVDVVNESTSDGDEIEGEVGLVSVETRGSGVTTIQGEAANVGGTRVESVVLRVRETESVSPMSASGEHFVGGLNASAFDTFELIAEVEGNASTVPVEVEYLVDGERLTKVQQVPVDSGDGAAPSDFGRDSEPGREEQFGEQRMQQTPPQERSTGLLGGIGGLLVPVVLVVGLLGGGYVLWRR
ncbi:hypothetical protein [Halomicrobium salinisoli]|uniref:hypothetical protein n=1 Tax=Halomicrobium salinisoli TaxID=2878391 RepID=UPI001CF0AB5F|nr:hypothetical protein [Halomicrobium salinisoli]